MKPTTPQTHWKICLDCRGQGKIIREPSRKRWRIYQSALDALDLLGEAGEIPKPPGSNKDICPICVGSGLIPSDALVPPESRYPHVAIVGGGIGGTALAVACMHRGIPFTLYERDRAFDARSQGYGLTLQQASKAIAGLGIFPLEDGITSTRHVVHNSDGRIIGEWGLRKWKIEFEQENSKRKNVHITRQALRSALLGVLGDHESIRWGYKLIDFAEEGEGSMNINFEAEGNIKTSQADLIVGADGIRSSVRGFLISEETTPLRYLGCIVILGICRLDALDGSDSSLLDSATVFQTVNGHERIYAMPYDTEHIMWQLSFPMTESEAKTLSSQGVQAMKDESLRRLGTWHDPIPQMLAATDASDITGYPVYDREILDPALLIGAGNVTLIGDAAHPMSPFKGQGANQALLDALTLARSITTACGPESNWREKGLRNSVLESFEKEMIQRTASKVRDSAKAVRLLHSDAVLHEGNAPRGRGIE